MKKLAAVLISIGSIAILGPAHAAVGKAITKPMRYSACLAFIAQTAQISGAAPVNIVETPNLRIVRIPAEDGSVLLTCNGSKSTMTLVPSSNTCGSDVDC